MRQVSLSFYEKRKKQSGWAIIGGAQEERLYWEQWCAPADFQPPSCAPASCRSARPMPTRLAEAEVRLLLWRTPAVPVTSFGASMQTVLQLL